MQTETKRLAIRFLDGTASKEEAKALFDYVTASPDNMKDFRAAEKFWEKTHIPSEEVLGSLKALKSDIRTYRRKQRLRRAALWSAAAASIIFAVFITGREIWKFHEGKGQAPGDVQEYIVEVPLGMNTRIALPDGTCVMVNAGSRLSYTSEFNKSTREVSLSGEAYFEVAHNGELPFKVKAGGCTVSVLGTRFDVSAYNCDGEVLTALMEGSVVFTAGDREETIRPGELATFSNGCLKVEQTDVEQYRGWTRGLIKYNDISFATLLKRLEREYNKTIILLDGSLADRNIRVSFSREDSIDTIMKVLSDILPIQVRKDGKAYYVSREKTDNLKH